MFLRVRCVFPGADVAVVAGRKPCPGVLTSLGTDGHLRALSPGSFVVDLAPCSPGRALVPVLAFTSTAPVPSSPPAPVQPSFSSNL